jgi:hypothetical protein
MRPSPIVDFRTQGQKALLHRDKGPSRPGALPGVPGDGIRVRGHTRDLDVRTSLVGGGRLGVCPTVAGPDDERPAISLRHLRHQLLAGTGALALLLAACGGTTDEEAQPPPIQEPEPDDEPGGVEVDPDEDGDEGATEDPTADAGAEDDLDDGIDPIAGEATTGPHEADGESGTLVVTDVRVATHDGFDRVVFETDGDGVPGWFVEYAEATAQGSGEPVEVDGEVTLRVAITMVTLPPELPDDLEPWDGERLEGPTGGVVDELVEDTIFEGHHTFFVGLDEERPVLVERFDDPDRVVIDVPHDG